MEFNQYPLHRVLIQALHSFNRYPHHFDPAIVMRSSGFYSPLPYPYTWCAYRNQAIIVNVNDLYNNYEEFEQHAYEIYHHNHPYAHLEYDDEVLILDSFDSETKHNNGGYHQINPYDQVESNDEVLVRNSFDHETEHYNSGLNKKLISENLKLSIYSDDGEEGEVCAVCQLEFEAMETLGVLECKHRYHPTCIKEWLIRKNVCPVCKAQALMV